LVCGVLLGVNLLGRLFTSSHSSMSPSYFSADASHPLAGGDLSSQKDCRSILFCLFPRKSIESLAESESGLINMIFWLIFYYISLCDIKWLF
jgi:hypothetical protein